MRHSGTIAAIVILAIMAIGLFAVKADAALFSVRVHNGTKQEALANYPATVSVGNKDGKGKYQSRKTVESRTGKDGVAGGEIDATGATVMRAEVVYRGVFYRSEPVPISPGRQRYALDVPVYEITNDNSNVSIESRRMIVMTKNDRTLEVYETLVVSNTGNMAYVGRFNDELDLNQVLFIPMPRGYMLYGFTGYDSPKIRTLGNGIPTQNEVLPGTHELNIHYYVQSDTGEFDLDLLSQKGAPEINTFTLFFPKENAWKLKQSGLKRTGEEFVNKIPYAILKGRHGSILRMKVFGPAYEGGFGLWHISIILSFVLTAVTLFLARESIRSRALAREEQRLEDLIEELDHESSDHEVDGKYAFMRQTIQKRMDHISEYFGRG